MCFLFIESADKMINIVGGGCFLQTEEQNTISSRRIPALSHPLRMRKTWGVAQLDSEI